MKNYDLIQELRDKAPDRDKAVRLMVEVGGICLFVALWNVAMSFFNSEFSHEFYGLTYFCTGFFVTGFLFLVSAYGLRRRASWGKKISQLSIAVFAFMMLMSVFLIGKSWFNFSGNFGKDSLGDFFSVFKFLMFIILSVIFLARVLIPAYYSLHYLNRLESGGDSSLNEKKGEPDISDNAEDTKPVSEDGFEITKNQIKIACLIFVVEIFFIFSTGPVIILWKIATKSYLGENAMLRYSVEYEAVDKNNAPSFYKVVKVTYNGDNTVRSEEYYTWTGSIVTVNYKGNKSSGRSGLFVCNFVLGIFALLGMTLMCMENIKKGLFPYGLMIFGSAFIIGAVRLPFDIFLSL